MTKVSQGSNVRFLVAAAALGCPGWGHSRRFDYQTATSALPRTTDISDRPGMSEKCDFRTASDVPKVNLAHPARLAYRLSGQSIGGRNSDT